MKISAIVLVGNFEPYLEYCIESIKGITDDIYFFIVDREDKKLQERLIDISLKDAYYFYQEGKETNFAKWRNQILDTMRKNGTEWVLFVDADEVFANSDGTPVTRTQVEELINNEYKRKEIKADREVAVKFKAESFDFFTRHFLWNYFTVDARQGGLHYSEQRLFRLPKKPIKCEYQREVHEYLVWYRDLKKGKSAYFPERVRVTPKRRFDKFSPSWTVVEYENDEMPMIWHFGHCKGPEDLRKKYEVRSKIPSNPWNAERGDMTNDQYCAEHPMFTGNIAALHYAGKLPQCLRLW